MKVCSKCKISKSASKFGKDKNRPDGLQPRCKKCRKDHYNKVHDGSTTQKNNIINGRIRRSNWKAFMYSLIKDKECIVCGSDDYRVLEHHHRDPSMKFINISDCTTKGFNEHWKQVFIDEIDKCDVLCANCHRIHHYEDRNVVLDITEQ